MRVCTQHSGGLLGRRISLMALLLALALGGPAALHAQGAGVRQGFWIGFDLGYGTADISCDGCAAGDRRGGAVVGLAMGGTVSGRLLLGGELNGWGKWGSAVDDGGVILGNTSLVAYFYPKETGGFFVKAGAGLASYVAIDSSGATTNGGGFGGLVGVGYDIPIGRTTSLTPVANFRFGSIGTIRDDEASYPVGLDQNVLEVGLGITWH